MAWPLLPRLLLSTILTFAILLSVTFAHSQDANNMTLYGQCSKDKWGDKTICGVFGKATISRQPEHYDEYALHIGKDFSLLRDKTVRLCIHGENTRTEFTSGKDRRISEPLFFNGKRRVRVDENPVHSETFLSPKPDDYRRLIAYKFCMFPNKRLIKEIRFGKELIIEGFFSEFPIFLDDIGEEFWKTAPSDSNWTSVLD